MLIGVDISRTAEQESGLHSYAKSLVQAMARLDQAMARLDQANEYLLHPFVSKFFPSNYKKAYCPPQRNFAHARQCADQIITVSHHAKAESSQKPGDARRLGAKIARVGFG